METTQKADPTSRCRLILIIRAEIAQLLSDSTLRTVLAAGDVASIIFSPDQGDDPVFREMVAPLLAAAQQAGVAVIIDGDTRSAGRLNADGLLLGQDIDALGEAIDKFTPKMMVGAANVKTRHNALVIGELQPDFIMFGKPGGDIRSEPHPKNIALGDWWSSMVEISCIVLGGSDLKCVVEIAQSGAEFVALDRAIFVPEEGAIDASDAAMRVQQANELLDEHAPLFEDLED